MLYKHMIRLRENVFCFFLEIKPCLMLIKYSLIYCKVSQLQKHAFSHHQFWGTFLKLWYLIRAEQMIGVGVVCSCRWETQIKMLVATASLLSYTKTKNKHLTGYSLWYDKMLYKQITSNFSQDIVPSFGIARIYVLLYFYPHSQY